MYNLLQFNIIGELLIWKSLGSIQFCDLAGWTNLLKGFDSKEWFIYELATATSQWTHLQVRWDKCTFLSCRVFWWNLILNVTHKSHNCQCYRPTLFYQSSKYPCCSKASAARIFLIQWPVTWRLKCLNQLPMKQRWCCWIANRLFPGIYFLFY